MKNEKQLDVECTREKDDAASTGNELQEWLTKFCCKNLDDVADELRQRCDKINELERKLAATPSSGGEKWVRAGNTVFYGKCTSELAQSFTCDSDEDALAAIDAHNAALPPAPATASEQWETLTNCQQGEPFRKGKRLVETDYPMSDIDQIAAEAAQSFWNNHIGMCGWTEAGFVGKLTPHIKAAIEKAWSEGYVEGSNYQLKIMSQSADTKRLDWLGKHHHWQCVCTDGQWNFTPLIHANPVTTHDLREAIDNAMRKDK